MIGVRVSVWLECHFSLSETYKIIIANIHEEFEVFSQKLNVTKIVSTEKNNGGNQSTPSQRLLGGLTFCKWPWRFRTYNTCSIILYSWEVWLGQFSLPILRVYYSELEKFVHSYSYLHNEIGIWITWPQASFLMLRS